MILRKIIYKNFIKASQDRQILSNLYGKIILKQKSKASATREVRKMAFVLP